MSDCEFFKARLADYLLTSRRASQLTQRELADSLDVHFTYISKIENCAIKAMPSVDLVTKMAELFGDNPTQVLSECGLVSVSALADKARESYWFALLFNRIALGELTLDDLLDSLIFAPKGEPAESAHLIIHRSRPHE